MSTIHAGAAFYSVADAKHFVGLVALLNSLRLVGHEDPVLVTDCGLDARQRAQLVGHVTLVEPEDGGHPMLQKPTAPLRHPAELMVLLDADVIVTRPLDELLRQAEAGSIVAFRNDRPRFFPEWAAVTQGVPPRRQAYVASGHLFVSHDSGRRLLELLRAGQSLIDLRRTLAGIGTPDDPFYYPDMDVLNAVLATAFEEDELVAVDQRLSPFTPFHGVEVVDERRLSCRDAEGLEPFVLHHALAKPWLAAVHANAYSQLLPRLLLGDDVELRLSPRDLPFRFRYGRLGAADRARVDLQATLRPYVRGRLGIRRRLHARRRRALG